MSVAGSYAGQQVPPQPRGTMINDRSFIKGGINKETPAYLLKDDEWFDSWNMVFDFEKAKALPARRTDLTLVADDTNLLPAGDIDTSLCIIPVGGFDPRPPSCPIRTVVCFAVWDSNASRDDNFDIYINDVFVAHCDLSADESTGVLCIGSLTELDSVPNPDDYVSSGPGIELTKAYFDPAILHLGGSNTLEMRNVGENFNGNFGSVSVFKAENEYNTDTGICSLDNTLTYYTDVYSGGDGESFTYSDIVLPAEI
jgi:hypothetical protein